MKERFWRMFVRGYRQILDPYYQGFAAQIAFYLMLSLIPTIIILAELLGIVDISIDLVEEWIDQYVQSGMGNTVKNLIKSQSTAGNDIMLLISALWSSSRAQFGLMRITNYTYSGGRRTGGYLGERIRSLKTMFLLVLTIVFVIVALVYGNQILLILFDNIVETSLILKLWAIFRWPIALGLYFVVITYEYYVLPLEKKTMKEVRPGALFAAIGLVIVTMFYSFYTDYIVDYGLVYGSLASVVAIMLWFFFLSWVLVLGIVFNKVWADTNGGLRE